MPIALAIGMQNFRELLAGAHAMDRHFQKAALHENMPVIMGLLTVLYTGFFDSKNTAVIPYSERLKLLPSYLQQLQMESLGKSVDVEGKPVKTNTGEIIWGTAGTDGQHSYFQLLHQGTQFVPVDFIALAKPRFEVEKEQHQHLLANCFGQSLTLMKGNTDSEAPHKNLPGNKPSNTLMLRELNPYNLGSLIALYEHKVFVQSVIWNINAFDQWGVESGKFLSREMFDSLSSKVTALNLDASTNGLIQFTRKWDE
jgi:glucose-6-phosphate isomerase